MKKQLLVLLAVLLNGAMSYAQLSGIKTIPGTYATVAAAIADLNSQGVGTGGVTFNVASGYTETFTSATAGDITTNTGSATRPIVFQKSGTGVNPKISAFALSSASATAGIIKFAGTDYITFNGIDLAENPLNAAFKTNWGYAILVATATDASQYIQIKNCAITLDKTNTTSKGIYSRNHPANSTTLIIPTVPAGSVSFCDVDNCDISNVYTGIYFYGHNAPAPYSLCGQSNRFGYTTGNTITNFGGDAVIPFAIFTAYQNDLVAANNTINGGAGTTAGLTGIYISTSNNANVDIYNNNVTLTSLATSTSSFYGIYNAGSDIGTSNTVNIYNNIVENCSQPAGVSMNCYFINNSASAITSNIHHNTIRNNSRPGVGSTTYLLYLSTASSVETENVYENLLHGNAVTGTGTGIFYGLYCNNPSLRKFVYSNSVYNNSSTGGSIHGIFTSNGEKIKIFQNNIYDQTINNTAGLNYGLKINGGTNTYCYNNLFFDLKAPITSNVLAVRGISAEGTDDIGLYYNTVFLNSSGTGAIFGSASVYASTNATLDMRNNILVNISVPNGTGKTVAYWRSNSTISSYAAISGNNDFYAGTPGSQNNIFYDGVNSMQTLADYKLFVAPKDAYSFTELPPFVNISTTPYNLHLIAAVPSQCESGGQSFSSPLNIASDYDQIPRFPNTGYPNNITYPATSPDAGAFEFAGIPLDLNPPTIIYSPLSNTSLLSNRTLTAAITDVSGVPISGIGQPVCYWKINSGSYTAVQGVYVSGNNYSFTFGTGVLLGDIVSYYIVAQDLAIPPHTGANPSAGTSGFTINPPACSVPPTTPSSYTIVKSVSGVVTVGSGGTYPSLTGAGGLFQDINSSTVTGNITAKVISDLTEDGSNALNRTTEDPPGNYTISILPDAGTERLIQGNVASPMIRLNGAQRVIFDGRYNGSGKYLRFRNTNTANADFEFSNDASYNTLRDCYWESGNTTTTNATTGVIRFYQSTGSIGNSYNLLQNNVIRDLTNTNSQPYTGIYTTGSATANNANNTITGNEILNFTTYGFYLSLNNGDNWTITGNSFYNNLALPLTTSFRAINFTGGTLCNGNIFAGNYVGGSAPMCGGSPWVINSTGTIYGMYLTAGITVPSEVYNNVISNFYNTNTGAGSFYGIYLASGSSFHCGTQGGNIIGSNTSPDKILFDGTMSFRGIHQLGTNPGNTIENNVVGNITWSKTTGTLTAIYGINATVAQVRKNKVFKIGSSQAGFIPTIYGIYSTGAPGSSNEYSNNIIDLDGGAAANPTVYGFYENATNNSVSKLYFNTIYIHGPATTTTSTYAWRRAGGATTLMNDNIIFNDRVSGGSGNHYAVYDAAAGAIIASDYNDIFTTSGMLGYYNAANVVSLPAWQAVTFGDLQSISINPNFVSINDLHPANFALSNAGLSISGITTDFDGILRGNPPDIGAYEFVQIPVITTTAATGITTAAAMLNGTVMANNAVVVSGFEYGLTTSYGSTVAGTPLNITGTTLTAINAALTGLTPCVVYHYRATGMVGATPYYGSDMTFTLLCPPTVITTAATLVTSTTATLNGTVNANSLPTTVSFDYGLTTAYGTNVAGVPVTITGNIVTASLANITGLSPNTLYHFRINGTHSGGTINGNDMTFTTNAAAPTVTTTAATPVGFTTATLNGIVNANNSSTAVSFEYGLTIAYGNTVPGIPTPVTGALNTNVSAPLTGLLTNTTYHFRVIGVNTSGTSNGLDFTFLTGCPQPAAAGTITGPANVCVNGTGYVYTVPVIANATTYIWTMPTGATITAGANTNSITVSFAGTAISGNFSVVGSSACGSGTASPNLAVTVNAQPVPTITGPATLCAGSAGNVYTTQAGMTAYTWTLSPGGVITAGTGTNAITVLWNTAGAQTVCVNYNNANGCSASTPVCHNVTVNALPVPTVTGPASVCVNSTGNVYTTQAAMTNYTWTVSAGGTITAGGTSASNTVTVTWNTTGAKTVCVNYTNASGCNAVAPVCYNVTVTPVPVPTITGTSSACQGTTGLIYSTEAGMSNYIWTVSTGGTITAGGTSTSNTVTVTWTTSGAKTVTVNYTSVSGCAATTPVSYAVTVNPTPVPTIGSTNNPCVGSTNNIYYTESGMTGYVWTVSAGGTIVSGQGTSTLNVTWNQLGNQTVSVTYTGTTGCPATGSGVYTVFVNSPPSAAGAITGTASLCAGTNGVSYSTTPVTGAVSYSWTVPSGATIATGTGTTSITVDFGASAVNGNVTVAAANQCGNGPASTFAVTVNPLPAAAGSITGPAFVCAGSTGAYSVATIANATSYVWAVPVGATITAGANTKNIVVTFGLAAGAGVITVKGTNTCGSGTVSPNFAVTINATPPAPVVTAVGNVLTSSAATGNQWYYEGNIIAGATGQTYTVTNNSGNYSCVVTLNGCSSPVSNLVWVVVTGVQELQSGTFNIYPVPSDGKFTVSITSAVQESYTILIYNQLGAKIYELKDVQVNGTFEKQVDLRPLASGFYTIVLRNKDKQMVKKFIVRN